MKQIVLEATSHSIDLTECVSVCHINLLYACGYHYLCNRVAPQIYLKAWVSFAVRIFSVSSWDVAVDCLFSPPFWAPNLKPACPVKHVVTISGFLGFLLFIVTSADVSNFTLKGFLILLSPSLLLPNTSEGVCSVALSLLGVQGIFIAVHLQSETTRILRLKY